MFELSRQQQDGAKTICEEIDVDDGILFSNTLVLASRRRLSWAFVLIMSPEVSVITIAIPLWLHYHRRTCESMPLSFLAA